MPNANPTHVVTGKVRFSYEHVMRPQASANDPTAEPKYSVTMLIPKTDTATKARIDAGIKAALQLGVKNRKIKEGLPLDKLPTPLYDGDGVRADGYTPFGPECKGMWVFTASCGQDRKPQVVDAAGNPIIDASEIYSGCWGRVSLDFYAYSVPQRTGIGAGLCNVQKLADGEPLGGARPSASDDFGATDDDPLG